MVEQVEAPDAVPVQYGVPTHGVAPCAQVITVYDEAAEFW